MLHVKNSPEFLTHRQNFDTMYSTGSSIKGPITNAMAISSWPGKELIAMASASGEFRASVVIVRLAYSGYVKLIFSDTKRSMMTLMLKNMIKGMKIVTTDSMLVKSSSP